jgi:hypothetical protein
VKYDIKLSRSIFNGCVRVEVEKYLLRIETGGLFYINEHPDLSSLIIGVDII